MVANEPKETKSPAWRGALQRSARMSKRKLAKRKKKWQCVTPMTGHRIVDSRVKTKNTKNG